MTARDVDELRVLTYLQLGQHLPFSETVAIYPFFFFLS